MTGSTPVEVLLIGGCVLEFTQDTLVERGRDRGLAIACRHVWPAPGSFGRIPAEPSPDVIVLQPTIQPFLSRVWDDGAFHSADARRRHTGALARFLQSGIDEFATNLGGAVGLVHNVAPPSVSPFGRLDFRTRMNYREIVAELNSAIDEACARHDGLMVVDEERLAARHGAAHLFDDLLFPFGHHGGAVDPAIAEPHQLPALSEALADEYLACYEIAHGLRRVRCIAVDLDGVLWPGVLAEDGMGWIDVDTTTRWIHQGLHQALRLLKERGILLVSLSKGTADATLSAWNASPDARLLSTDDFVLHSIAWEPKPERLLELCERLGLMPKDVLFLDDHPVEQAAMRARLPEVHVYEGSIERFRGRLLTDPRCEVAQWTEESRTRTETTKAVLQRAEMLREGSASEFLASLEIEVTVGPLTASQSQRAIELLARTTQFTTVGRPLARADATELLSRTGISAFTATVADRFTSYGLCAVVVVGPGEVEAMVLSCRVIGLDVAVVILVSALRLAGRLRPGVLGTVTEVGRNAPAHDVFSRAGFTKLGPGRYRIDDPGEVARRGRFEHVELRMAGDAT